MGLFSNHFSNRKADNLIVGLGNPGEKYAATRHNAGFIAVDALAEELGADNWRLRFDALVSEKKFALAAGQGATATATSSGSGSGSSAAPAIATLVLAKPQTFMNSSGRAVKGLVKHYGLEAAKILVIHDDLDLPVGGLRIKTGGGHGGHNGIRDIIDAIGPDFLRIKIGVGRPPGRMETYDYVLQQMRGQALEDLKVDASRAAKAVLCILQEGVANAQTKYN